MSSRAECQDPWTGSQHSALESAELPSCRGEACGFYTCNLCHGAMLAARSKGSSDHVEEATGTSNLGLGSRQRAWRSLFDALSGN